MQESKLGSETRDAVEEYIKTLISRRCEEALAVHPRYQELWDKIYDISTRGGKRMRPYLTMVAYGEFSDVVVPIAAAQELIHMAMLVHDDIIDQDTIRHGRHNIGGHYTEEYGQYLENRQASHYASSTALIAGDALIAEAHLAITHSSFDGATTKQLAERLHRSIFEVVGGELLDFETSFMEFNAFDPTVISRYKTAGYSFIGPLLSGAICRKVDDGVKKSLEEYGLNAGIAFQLQDDLLGVFGDETKTGKSTTSDLRESRYTVLIAEHKRTMSEEMSSRFTRIFGSPDATEESINQLKDDIEASGARQRTEDMVRAYIDKALKSIEGLAQFEELHRFTMLMMERSK